MRPLSLRGHSNPSVTLPPIASPTREKGTVLIPPGHEQVLFSDPIQKLGPGTFNTKANSCLIM
jgi:hypothetical protein